MSDIERPIAADPAGRTAPRRRDRLNRGGVARARTLSRAALRREIRAAAAAEATELTEPTEAMSPERPRTRGECRDGPRPCPWVGCRFATYLDVNPETGSIKLNYPDLEPWELRHSCALDVAEQGAATLEEVAEILNLTRERVRQVEVEALIRLRRGSPSPDDLGAVATSGGRP